MASKMNLVKGKILFEEGKYFVEVDQVKYDLSKTVSERKIKPLVGKEIEVELSEPVKSVYAVFGTGTVRPPRIICYVPVPDFRNPLIEQELIQFETMKAVAVQLRDSGAITKEVYEKLVG